MPSLKNLFLAFFLVTFVQGCEQIQSGTWLNISFFRNNSSSVKSTKEEEVVIINSSFEPPQSSDISIHKSYLTSLPLATNPYSLLLAPTLDGTKTQQLEPAISRNWMTIDCQKGTFDANARLAEVNYIKFDSILKSENSYSGINEVNSSIKSLESNIEEAKNYIERIKSSRDLKAKLGGKTLEEWGKVIEENEAELDSMRINSLNQSLGDNHFCIHKDGSRVFIPDWDTGGTYRLRVTEDFDTIIEKIRI